MVIITEKTTTFNVVFENNGYEVTIEQDFLNGGVTYTVLDDAGNELRENKLKLAICEYVEINDPINAGVLTDKDIENAGGENYEIFVSEED
jgi:hypothetical protein